MHTSLPERSCLFLHLFESGLTCVYLYQQNILGWGDTVPVPDFAYKRIGSFSFFLPLLRHLLSESSHYAMEAQAAWRGHMEALQMTVPAECSADSQHQLSTLWVSHLGCPFQLRHLQPQPPFKYNSMRNPPKKLPSWSKSMQRTVRDNKMFCVTTFWAGVCYNQEHLEEPGSNMSQKQWSQCPDFSKHHFLLRGTWVPRTEARKIWDESRTSYART